MTDALSQVFGPPTPQNAAQRLAPFAEHVLAAGMFGAMAINSPDHPDASVWLKNARERIDAALELVEVKE